VAPVSNSDSSNLRMLVVCEFPSTMCIQGYGWWPSVTATIPVSPAGLTRGTQELPGDSVGSRKETRGKGGGHLEQVVVCRHQELHMLLPQGLDAVRQQALTLSCTRFHISLAQLQTSVRFQSTPKSCHYRPTLTLQAESLMVYSTHDHPLASPGQVFFRKNTFLCLGVCVCVFRGGGGGEGDMRPTTGCPAPTLASLGRSTLRGPRSRSPYIDLSCTSTFAATS